MLSREAKQPASVRAQSRLFFYLVTTLRVGMQNFDALGQGKKIMVVSVVTLSVFERMKSRFFFAAFFRKESGRKKRRAKSKPT